MVNPGGPAAEAPDVVRCTVCVRRACVCNVAVLAEILRDAAALSPGGACIVGVRGAVHQLEIGRARGPDRPARQ